MEPLPYIAFIVASITLIVIPGPNVLVIVSTTISHGMKRGMQTILGTSSAMMIQLIITAVGTSWFVGAVYDGFEWLRWLGVGYLAYLGLVHLWQLVKNQGEEKANATGSSSFARGFIVSLSNPKTILFFGAFLPQFASPAGSYPVQIFILSFTFLILATLLDGMYALLADRISGAFMNRRMNRLGKGASGLLYLGAGAWLAILRKV